MEQLCHTYWLFALQLGSVSSPNVYVLGPTSLTHVPNCGLVDILDIVVLKDLADVYKRQLLCKPDDHRFTPMEKIR